MYEKAKEYLSARLMPYLNAKLQPIVTDCPTCAFVRGFVAGVVACLIVRWVL